MFILLRIWKNVADAIKANDQAKATVEKSRIEENQRKLVRERAESGVQWEPRFFENVDGKWQLKSKYRPPQGLDDAEQWRNLLFSRTQVPLYSKFWLE